LVCPAVPSGVSAEESWTLIRLGGSVDDATSRTFTQLLGTELSTRTKPSFKTADAVCEDGGRGAQKARVEHIFSGESRSTGAITGTFMASGPGNCRGEGRFRMTQISAVAP
jgi:hypothetical protein